MMMRRSHREARQPEDEGRKYKSSTASPAPLSPLSPFPKTRCYRLNLEKPFDISQTASCSSPLFRNRDYSGPISEADLPPVQGPAEYYPPPHLCRQDELRRHSWNGNSEVDLMANLQVSESTDSQNNETSVAISTARIFRGITVDRNGVILTQNARAMRSKKTGDKNKLGEKSRQAAKIDKAKDLIDEVLEAANDENDPSKIVSLYVMGEYDELNDLVRDGSKKLRESKSLSDEAIFMYNRPRPVPPYITSPNNSVMTGNMPSGHHRHINSPSNASQDPTMASPTNRKRVLGSRGFKNVPRSAPPKLKSHPRDNRPSNRTRKSSAETSSSNPLHHEKSPSQQHQHSHHHQQPHAPHPHQHHYFREQCNFFPGPHSNWTEAFGFSVNSLWNCGANNGHMSPTSHSVSPRSHASGGVSVGGNGGYGGDPNAYSNNYHTNGSGYHYGYEEGRDPTSTGGHGGAGGHYEDGYGRSRNGGVRDTVVM
ncbi:hypothetical protein ACHAXN_002317 [Cyclotella atomus]